MNETCEQYQVLISGYLDGELTGSEKQSLEEHMKTCSTCRREYEVFKRVSVGTAHALAPPEPPPEVWDAFLENVYNRMERRTGHVVFWIGFAALLIYAIVLFALEPWVSALTKTLIAFPVTGLAILFVSVLRQRLHAAKTDRYTREVRR